MTLPTKREIQPPLIGETFSAVYYSQIDWAESEPVLKSSSQPLSPLYLTERAADTCTRLPFPCGCRPANWIPKGLIEAKLQVDTTWTEQNAFYKFTQMLVVVRAGLRLKCLVCGWRDILLYHEIHDLGKGKASGIPECHPKRVDEGWECGLPGRDKDGLWAPGQAR